MKYIVIDTEQNMIVADIVADSVESACIEADAGIDMRECEYRESDTGNLSIFQYVDGILSTEGYSGFDQNLIKSVMDNCTLIKKVQRQVPQ